MSDATPAGVGTPRPAVFAALALPVLGAVALNGFWMAKGLVVAVVAVVAAPSWTSALAAIAPIAGIQGGMVVFRAWRALYSRSAEPASSDRKTLVAIAALAGVAAVVALCTAPALATSGPDAVDVPTLVDAPWFPAFRLALLAASAALLAMVPGPSRAAADQLWMRQLRGRGHALSHAASANGRAGVAGAVEASAAVARGTWIVARTLAEFAEFVADAIVAGARALARGLASFAARDALGRHLFAFALLAAPVVWVLVPLAFTLLEYGWLSILMIVGIFFLPLMLVYAGALAALVGLWWALLDVERAAPAWARVLAVIGIPLNLGLAWLLRESPDHYALVHPPAFGRFRLTPPIVAALDAVVLRAIHALRRPPESARPLQDAAPVELVPWQRLSAGERDAVLSLEISAEQIEFAGTTARSVDACEAGDPAAVAGLAIRAAGDIVGWVLLKRGVAAPEWVGAQAAVVGGLRIDRRHQGRGLGTAALDELPRWVARHWLGTSALALRVDDANAAGIRAYEKAGWTEVGERRVGRVGLERTMTLRL